MSAGNIKDKGSNYGSNYSYQLAVLKLLDQIATSGGGGGGSCPCPSSAQEDTLVLAKNLLATIDTDTSNLDVALSTRATETTLTTVKNNVESKMDRIRGSANYTRTFTYVSSGTSGSNITSIVHTGTTALGSETITETFTYFGSTTNINTITYS
jgi:hypothetical protein